MSRSGGGSIRSGRGPGSGSPISWPWRFTAAAIWLVAVAPGAGGGAARGSSSEIALIVLIANLALIAGLAFIVGRRVLTLARSTEEAGSRLHLRFVALFSMVALIPSVLIALVFGVSGKSGGGPVVQRERQRLCRQRRHRSVEAYVSRTSAN